MKASGGVFQRLKHEKWAFVIVVVLSILMKFLEFQGWLAPTEGRIFDRLHRWSSATKTAAKSPVATVLIDDEDYANCFHLVEEVYLPEGEDPPT